MFREFLVESNSTLDIKKKKRVLNKKTIIILLVIFAFVLGFFIFVYCQVQNNKNFFLFLKPQNKLKKCMNIFLIDKLNLLLFFK